MIWLVYAFVALCVGAWSLEAAGVSMGWPLHAALLGLLVCAFVAEQLVRHRRRRKSP